MIASEFVRFAWGSLLLSWWPILLMAVSLVAAWLVVRYLGWLPRARALPRSAPVGSRLSHRAEAIVLLCAAAAIFAFTATNTSTGGRLLILDQLRPGFALVNVLAAVAAGLGALIGVLITLFRRTSTGVIVAAGVLCIYGMVLNGPQDLLESLAPEDPTVPDASLTFVLSTPDVEGAELYVNGVHLGTLPYETTYDKFYREVPFWEDEPNEFKPENRDSWLHLPFRRHPGHSRPSTQDYCPWVKITVPERPTKSDRPRASFRATREGRTYYARVKLGDEWGYAGGGSLNSGGDPREGRAATVLFGSLFPERQARIERLLDLARLNDCAPGSEWFEAMETYRSDGWITLRKAMDKEPGMSQALDRWATWRYHLDAATDAESAWRIFERIRREAKERRYYLTSDITGRAVELLTPRLDPDALVCLARRIIQSTSIYSWETWQMNDRAQFGATVVLGGFVGFRTGANQMRSTGFSAGGRGDERLSPGDYAVAHALWMLDRALDARDDAPPNIVEQELVPAFIARNYDNVNLLRIAVPIGGPAIERCLLRQDWRADPEDLPWGHQLRIHGSLVNGWLHLLANLQSPTGRQFRQENQSRLLEMVDRLNERSFLSLGERGFEFLFLDLDLGANSLALRYWPRFKEAATHEKHDALSLQYQYLARMEPLSTVDMYVQCWKEFRGDETGFYEALDSLAKSSVPYHKRQEIHAALADQIQRNVKNVEAPYQPDERSVRRNLLLHLEEKLLPITDEARAAGLLAELQAGSPRYKPENVAAWLTQGAPAHPLVGMLADANAPSLRLLVMGALREHPTPANQALLQKLLHDGDAQVRGAAQTVAAALTTLKETPATQLADRKKEPTRQ